VIGETIEHYRVLEVVGRGGMGVVYKALDVNLERTVAVKVLSAELREDPDFIERFRNEARIQAALNHPNVATLFDFFLWNGSPVTVMEFIQGETLQSTIERRGPIPGHLALPIFVQALRGVSAGHRRGIVHRDLKPANLMITDEGVVKVMDFGIAKLQSSSGLTQASTRVGSSSYMAPEQILGRPVDARTDIYALGVTLYELLCGRPPFQAKALFEIEEAHVRELPAPPTTFYPHIPPAAVDAVMRALAKDPGSRFATVDEFMQALPDLHGVAYVATAAPVPPSNSAAAASTARVLSATRPTEPARPAPRAPRRRGPLAAAAVVIAVVAAILVLRFADITTSSLFGWNEALRSGGPPPSSPSARGPQTIGSLSAPQASPQTLLHPVPSQPPPAVPATQSSATEPSAPRKQSAHADLSGLWTGVYSDVSGRAQLKVLNLEMQQASGGDVIGSLTYQAGGGQSEKCTLQRSTYSTETKRLRLIVHCADPNHPRYLNVPLDFTDVDPRASSLHGGRLAFHLADDIVVSLMRARRS
jgi:eukaryotic-like serine/threonine-protein kinase